MTINNIAEGLRPLAYKIENLKFDPKNARVHPDRNIEAIRESLVQFGQRRPLVVNYITNIVIAGNGVLQAAKSLGWTEIAVLFVEDDERTATGYALADNRTSETSRWDRDVLQDLVGLLESTPDLLVGWSEDEIREIMNRPLPGGEDLQGDQEPDEDPLSPSEEAAEPQVKTLTLYIPADEYETFMADVDRLQAQYQTPDISATLIRAVEVWSKQ